MSLPSCPCMQQIKANIGINANLFGAVDGDVDADLAAMEEEQAIADLEADMAELDEDEEGFDNELAHLQAHLENPAAHVPLPAYYDIEDDDDDDAYDESEVDAEDWTDEEELYDFEDDEEMDMLEGQIADLHQNLFDLGVCTASAQPGPAYSTC